MAGTVGRMEQQLLRCCTPTGLRSSGNPFGAVLHELSPLCLLLAASVMHTKVMWWDSAL